ncbi:MAG: GIY-YIG nuclease family protein [Rhodospirillales bacterium]|nr:GIY-YIG nuclease family protein [Rhodospirillales bacterium]
MSIDQTFGRTIQLFLVDGKSTGLRKATLHGWTGQILVSGNSTFADLMAREEADRTGFYILSGPDPDKPDATKVYIGCGNSVAKRIKESAGKREFWETAIAVTTSDGSLSKGHAEYLETRLIKMTDKAGRVTLDNGTQPGSGDRLPEADKANMERFLANVAVVLPVIGLDMLKPQPRAVTQTTAKPAGTGGDVQFEIRHTSRAAADTPVAATAVEEDGEFVVLQNSDALTGTGLVQQKGYRALKDKLIADGVLIPDGAKKLRFAKAWPFGSPSAAAAVVLDRNSNGRTAWTVKGSNSNQSYHDWQQEQAAKHAAAQ